MRVIENVLDGKVHIEVLHQQIADILEIMETNGHVLAAVLELATPSHIHPLKYHSKEVTVLEV